MALLPWQKGIVIRIEDESWNTKRFWIQLPELEIFDFKPGQFVTLDLPIHEKPNKRWRSYSIASAPNGTNIFELLIVLLEGGVGSSFLFHDIKVGSALTLRGPLGVFTLPPVIHQDLFFICTGTGIAPFRSMLHYIKDHRINHKKIFLIFGTRERKDLLFLSEMKDMEASVEGFRYIPTLSRETWEGCCGYVHAVYESLIQEQFLKEGVLPEAQFFLCGWKNMVDEAKERILKLGFDKKAIHLELYG